MSSLIQFPTCPFVDSSGKISKPWLLWLQNPQFVSLVISETLGIDSGGTGIGTVPGAGQILIGNGAGYALHTITAGSGVTITNGAGTITISVNTSGIAIDTSQITSGYLAAARFPALSGDISNTTGSLSTALATVNANVGSFGSASSTNLFTVNGKGLITAASNTPIAIANTQVSGLGTMSVQNANAVVLTADAQINSLTFGRGGGNITTNLAMGNIALNSNTTAAYNNTAIGSGSLQNLNNGAAVYNTGVGAGTLNILTSGYYNTAIGVEALRHTNGNANTAIGTEALWSCQQNNNVAVGSGAIYSSVGGWNNVGIGVNCLYSSVTPKNNVAIGYNAGNNSLNVGNNNIYIGWQAYASAGSINNEIVIGAGAVGLGANITVIGNSSTIQTNFFGSIKSTNYIVSGLPSAATAGVGARAFVTDALAPVFGSTVAGSGTIPTPVYSDGSVWKVG